MNESPSKYIVAIAVALATAALMVLHLTASPPVPAGRDALMFRGNADTLRVNNLRTDFASFYYAAKVAKSDLNMYDAFTLDSLAALDGVSNHVLPYVYPPFLAIIISPLAEMPPVEAQRMWDYIQVVLAMCSAVLLCLTLPWKGAGSLPDSYWVRAGLFTLAGMLMLPFGQNIAFGQVNIAVLFFISLSFYFLHQRRSDWLAGFALAAAILIKVTPAFLVLFLLFSWRWKALTATVIGAGLLVLATFDIAGRDVWGHFMQFLPNMGFARSVDGGFHPSIPANFSIAGFFMRLFPGEGTLVRILTMLSILALFVILLFHQLKYRDKRGSALFVLPYLILMVIASPVTWLHHLVYLLPGVVFVLRDFKVELRAGIWFLGLTLLLLFSAMDYQSFYSSMNVSEEARPFVTSLNLFVLVAAFFVSLRISARRGSLLVTG